MSTKVTEPTSISDSKAIKELRDEMQVLKGENSVLSMENQMLQSVREMLSPSESEPSVEPAQKLMQVYPHIAEMLSNEGFKEAYARVLDDIQRQVFNTQADEGEIRERLYFQAQAMQSLLLKLGGMAKEAQRGLKDHTGT